MYIAFIVVLFAACVVFAALYMKASKDNDYDKAIIVKGLATICCIIISGIAVFHTNSRAFAVLVVFGVFFGFLGDEFLALRYIFRDKFNEWFLAGSAAFLVGHVFYLIALYGIAPKAWMLAVPLTVVLLIADYFATKKLGMKLNKLAVPLGIYAAIVCFMACTSLSVCIFSFSFGTLLFAIGGLCFGASDCILSIQCFSGNPTYKKSLILHVLYWSAQLLIAISPLFI